MDTYRQQNGNAATSQAEQIGGQEDVQATLDGTSSANWVEETVKSLMSVAARPTVPINICLLDPKCKPAYGHELEADSRGDGAMDCRSRIEAVVMPGRAWRVPLGFKLSLPPRFMGKIVGRSGLASHGIFAIPLVVDSNYQGEVQAVIYNSTHKPFVIHAYDRICQLYVEQAWQIDLHEIGLKDFPASSRGGRGFGSTGVK